MTIVVLDWDETVTCSDTISLVSEVPYSLGQPEYSWSHYTDIYARAYKECGHVTSASFDEELEFQKRTKVAELASIQELERTSLFKGIDPVRFSCVGNKIVLRDGAVSLLRRCKLVGLTTAILSLNWSSWPMREALRSRGCAVDRYYVNELEIGPDGKTTGSWTGRQIRTGADKLDVIRELKKEFQSVIYVGDSRSDLLALAEADLGVVVPESSLAKNIPLWAKNTLQVKDWKVLEKIDKDD